MRRYSLVFLEANEAAALGKKAERLYYRNLGAAVTRFHEQAFWRYHKEELETVGDALDRPYLAIQIGLEFLRRASNLWNTMKGVLQLWKDRTKSQRNA